MSSIRLKVQFNSTKSTNYNSSKKSSPSKFIYILNSPSTTTIAELINLLEKCITRQFLIKYIQIVQLMTDDGYILLKDNICSDVLGDNDRINCFDMESFIEENYSTLDLENLWCERKQYDASDNLEKYIQIGLNKLDKLFIRMRGTSDIYGLYLFNVFELIKIASEKQPNTKIARLSNANWFIEAKWEYNSTLDTTLFVVCSLKVGSSEHIWSNKLQLVLDESRMCIELGERISLSNEMVDEDILTTEQRERLKQLASTIPPAKRTGPEIDVARDVNKTITKYDCEGESLVRMTNGSTNTVTAYQDSLSSDGTFRQHFVITHITFSKKSMDMSLSPGDNKSTSIISVTNISVFYQTADKSWCECEDVAIAPIALRDEEPRWLADSIINIESDKFISLAIKGWMRIKGEPGKDNIRRRRIHKNLPQPLRLKIIITDNFNKQSSLIIEQLNKPLQYETVESFSIYHQSSIKDLLAFVYADDCELDERIFLAMFLNKEDQIVINSDYSFSITIDKNNIRTMKFNAKQNNTTEVVFDSISSQYRTQEKKATALFDSETFILYAIRLEVSTKTSKAEQTILLPLDKIK